MKTPVLLIVFNRLETTIRVFEKIRSYRPERLFIAADGARPSQPGDADRCEQVRNWVIRHIDWPCEVETLFHPANVGCGRGPSEAITWFFSRVDEGIILEDDCLPGDSFFPFCEILLEKYRHNSSISIISGNNFQPVQPMPIGCDYYFSVFPSTWGWATWKSTWEGYDITLKEWKRIKRKELLSWLFHETPYQLYWKETFDNFSRGNEIQTWDYQFYFHTMRKRQLAVIPKTNLVSNIGHGDLATHTTDQDSLLANLTTFELTFPLKHPGQIERNYNADAFIQEHLFGSREKIGPVKQIKRKVKKILRFS